MWLVIFKSQFKSIPNGVLLGIYNIQDCGNSESVQDQATEDQRVTCPLNGYQAQHGKSTRSNSHSKAGRKHTQQG